MHIVRLELQNFRCFESFTLNFHPLLNVIVGQNGAGKSSLMEALLVGAGGWIGAVGGKSGRRAGIREQDVRAAGTLIHDEFVFERQPFATVNLSQFLLGEYLITSSKYPKSDVISAEGGNARLRKLGLETQATVRGESDPQNWPVLPLVAYYGTERLWIPATPDSGLRGPMKTTELSRFSGYQGALERYRDPNTLLRWMERQARIAFQEGKEPLAYRIVCDAMCQMMEGASEVRFDNRTLEMAVRFENGTAQTFPQLSDGQRNMLALAGDFAVRMARLNPQLGTAILTETSGVVLIDELDLHLHPEWQRHVISDLRRTFPKIQFIVTTHSPIMLSEVQPESVTILSAEQQTTAITPHQSYGLDADGVLQSIMNTPSRPLPIQEAIRSADDALEDGELDLAREQVENLRTLLHGDDPEVARIEASINNIVALVDALD